MNIKKLSSNYIENVTQMNRMLRVPNSFDVVVRQIKIADRKASLYFVDGFVKDDIMERIMEYVLKITTEDLLTINTLKQFDQSYIPYVEVSIDQDITKLCTQILSGTIILLIEGFDCALAIDARTYPIRSINEPEDDRVLRGSRDGFVETLVFNTALIRRRIRDPHLTMKLIQVGSKSHTDIVVCYMSDLVDEVMLKKLVKQIEKIDVHSLTLAQESLAECLMKSNWWNPFPRVRYSERPDTACANVLEGKIIVIVDNSPAVMMLPTTFFDFVQETNDFYFPPLIGTYLRIVRTLVFILTIFLTPVWLLYIQNPEVFPSWLSFLQIIEMNAVPVIFQLLIIEFVIDAIKLASLNTPSSLASSFSVVGALILGDFAVKARWFVPEVLLYMAFVAIANFTQPSYELSYAFKLFRILILILTAAFNFWGFMIGVLLMLITIACTKTITGKSYLYPFIPFNYKDFKKLFMRTSIIKSNN